MNCQGWRQPHDRRGTPPTPPLHTATHIAPPPPPPHFHGHQNVINCIHGPGRCVIQFYEARVCVRGQGRIWGKKRVISATCRGHTFSPFIHSSSSCLSLQLLSEYIVCSSVMFKGERHILEVDDLYVLRTCSIIDVFVCAATPSICHYYYYYL